MSQQRLDCDNIGDLGEGRARAIINAAIMESTHDVDDRGEDGKERTVVIKLRMKRRSDGLVETVVAAQATLPPRQTASTVSKVTQREGRGPQLAFQSWASDNPDQNTFPQLDESEKE